MFEKGGKKGSMKKSKLSAGIISGLLAVGALAACSSSGPEYNSKGVILTYEVNGQKIEYTADDLFGEFVVNPEHAEEMFNQVYKLVVRNYFTVSNPDGEGTDTGLNQMEEINRIAEKNVQIDKDTAERTLIPTIHLTKQNLRLFLALMAVKQKKNSKTTMSSKNNKPSSKRTSTRFMLMKPIPNKPISIF